MILFLKKSIHIMLLVSLSFHSNKYRRTEVVHRLDLLPCKENKNTSNTTEQCPVSQHVRTVAAGEAIFKSRRVFYYTVEVIW